MVKHRAGVFVAAWFALFEIHGQTPAGSIEFEVASIKPSAPGSNMVQMSMMPGGRIAAKNITLKGLIEQAYGIRDFQIMGAPNWAGSERYDVTAKPESNGDQITRDDIKKMMQALLADRFHLAFHRETKELPTYALVVAKDGSKMKPVEGEARSNQRQSTMRGRVEGQMQMNGLAAMLANALGRSVINKTGLDGVYEVKLEWTPDQSQAGMMGPPPSGAETSATSADSSGATLFTALQEQLGLKLESTKGPVEILIVDKVEKPAEN